MVRPAAAGRGGPLGVEVQALDDPLKVRGGREARPISLQKR